MGSFLLSLDTSSLFILLIGALLAGFITGFAGFGTGLVASGFWFMVLPAEMVPPLIVITSVAGQIVGLNTVRNSFEWQRALPFLVTGCLAVPIGIFALSQSSPTTIRIAVGVFLVGYSMFQLSGLGRLSIGSSGGRVADTIVGSIGGFLGGFAGLSGPVPLIWLQLRGGPSASQRATYQPFNLIVLIVAGIGMIIGGQIDHRVAAVGLLCTPFTLVAATFGSGLYLSISEDLFRRFVFILLLVSGFFLVYQSVFSSVE